MTNTELYNQFADEYIDGLHSGILRSFFSPEFAKLSKKTQHERIDKLLDRANRIKEHLGNLGMMDEFRDVADMVSEVYELKKTLAANFFSMSKSEMMRLNDIWQTLNDKYPNIK